MHPAAASPGTGLYDKHVKEQARIVDDALSGKLQALPTLKLLSPEIFVGECRRHWPAGRPQLVLRDGERYGYSPGSEAVSSVTLRVGGNQGDPAVGAEAPGLYGRCLILS